jgi:hypothetical protein
MKKDSNKMIKPNEKKSGNLVNKGVEPKKLLS